MMPVETELGLEKRLVRTRGRALGHGLGVWGSLADAPVEGYEIHMGRMRALAGDVPLLELDSVAEGSVSKHLAVVGTHLHGLLERPEPRAALVRALAEARGFAWAPASSPPDPYDRLADVLEATLKLDGLHAAAFASVPILKG